MKKEYILFLAAIFMIVGVSALPNLASTFCEEQGYNYTLNGSVSYCDFGDGNICETLAFYNGSCGAEYKNIIDDDNETEDDDNETLRDRIKDKIQEKVKEKIEERKERIVDGIRMKRNITFAPWQKRNESECIEGCKCVGAVMMCRTENGKEITITAGRSGKTITITINKTKVDTELEVQQETDDRNITKIKIKTKDGKVKAIIMPDKAAERAIERLKLKFCNEENNCTMELKEVDEGQRVRIAYELNKEGKARLFWVIPMKMKVAAQIDAENGEVILVKKPWWVFLAKQQD